MLFFKFWKIVGKRNNCEEKVNQQPDFFIGHV